MNNGVSGRDYSYKIVFVVAGVGLDFAISVFEIVFDIRSPKSL